MVECMKREVFMVEKVLNITNGDCFNGYFISRFGGVAVPFCEMSLRTYIQMILSLCVRNA